MAHDKLTEADDGFLELPAGAVLVSSGVNGTASWIERDRTCTVRLVIATVALASTGGATLEAVIEAGQGGVAKAQDGPVNSDHHQHLQAVQSVQAVVKEGERLAFRAYPNAQGARVLRTVVYTAEVRAAG